MLVGWWATGLENLNRDSERQASQIIRAPQGDHRHNRHPTQTAIESAKSFHHQSPCSVEVSLTIHSPVVTFFQMLTTDYQSREKLPKSPSRQRSLVRLPYTLVSGRNPGLLT